MITGAVIPCFNEETTIGPLVSQLRRYLDLIVVVDDGSTDNTAFNAEGAGARVLRHDRNCGKGAALKTGLSHLNSLGCEWAVTLDGDGQHDPADLPGLLQCAEYSGALLVIGNRMDNSDAMPWLRRFVNRWMSRKLSQYSAHYLPDTQSGFRFIHLQTWANLPLGAQRFEVESEMLMAFLVAGHSVEFVPIRAIPAARKSRIRPLADSLRWFKWWGQMRRQRGRTQTDVVAASIAKNTSVWARCTFFVYRRRNGETKPKLG
ncbi:MAG TPA: glycosyltransferase family 2 protein [Verrucomicrobiae bacterium]|jgi:glycosyltransferase involved in cell wall biosynthesis|nr:glycosyltransferase family 2 protein [Verrucomicrobiae bacterium]